MNYSLGQGAGENPEGHVQIKGEILCFQLPVGPKDAGALFQKNHWHQTLLEQHTIKDCQI